MFYGSFYPENIAFRSIVYGMLLHTVELLYSPSLFFFGSGFILVFYELLSLSLLWFSMEQKALSSHNVLFEVQNHGM